jgi:hypothetical protein
MSYFISQERIESKIFLLRNEKIMLDIDLAILYGVETRSLIQAIKRNKERFPKDFMFRLNRLEYKILRSQIVISSWGGRRHLPYAFTEQGVAMLSSVLSSKRAVMVNIQIMRIFTRLRKILGANKELSYRLALLEGKVNSHDKEIRSIFEVMKKLTVENREPKRKIGFTI